MLEAIKCHCTLMSVIQSRIPMSCNSSWKHFPPQLGSKMICPKGLGQAPLLDRCPAQCNTLTYDYFRFDTQAVFSTEYNEALLDGPSQGSVSGTGPWLCWMI